MPNIKRSLSYSDDNVGFFAFLQSASFSELLIKHFSIYFNAMQAYLTRNHIELAKNMSFSRNNNGNGSCAHLLTTHQLRRYEEKQAPCCIEINAESFD